MLIKSLLAVLSREGLDIRKGLLIGSITEEDIELLKETLNFSNLSLPTINKKKNKRRGLVVDDHMKRGGEELLCRIANHEKMRNHAKTDEHSYQREET